MKFFAFLISVFLFLNCSSQIPKSGTYTYKYCDEEYNKCLENCTIKIKKDSIWIYGFMLLQTYQELKRENF